MLGVLAQVVVCAPLDVQGQESVPLGTPSGSTCTPR